jgi:hypothetical protein
MREKHLSSFWELFPSKRYTAAGLPIPPGIPTDRFGTRLAPWHRILAIKLLTTPFNPYVDLFKNLSCEVNDG